MVNVEMTVEQAVRLAINEEIKAHELYLDLSKKIGVQETRVMLLQLAEQELKHRLTLEKI
ncbi:rubrerythrin, partial [candidate division KSB1 bacterium]|nr:rubrerythrin [candidate division KSB1 bacterium]